MSTEHVHVSQHPQKDEMQALWESGKRAKEIMDWLSERGLPQVKYESLARYGQRNWSQEKVTVIVDEDYDDVQEIIKEISDSQGSVTKVTIDQKEAWGWEKQPDGSNEQVRRNTTSKKIEYVPEEKLNIDRAKIPKVTIKPSSASFSGKPDGIQLACSIPDLQIGGFMHSDGTIEPTQDEQAIDVALQIMADMQALHGIDLIVNQGDNLDLPAFSSHRSAPGYTHTTQYAIDRFGTFIATERALAPDAKIVEMPSNHVARMTNAIVDKIPALTGIRRANSDDPVLSLSYLCRFDEFGVDYVDGWPDGTYWAAPNLRFEHGNSTSSTPGGTARKYLREGISTVYGHSHHSELLWRSDDFQDDSRDAFAGSAGCLCRVDGFLPSGLTGITAAGTQAAQRRMPWQQGIWFIWYSADGSTEPIPEPVKIDKGRAIFRGKLYTANVDLYGNKL